MQKDLPIPKTYLLVLCQILYYQVFANEVENENVEVEYCFADIHRMTDLI